MILNVYFTENNDLGTAVLIENLITNEVLLELPGKIFIGKMKVFINKAVAQLKLRYDEVKVNINWRNIKESEE